MDETKLATQIENLLRETGEAHHQAFIDTDGYDPDWPIWYAGHMLEQLRSLLDATFTQSELTYLLIRVANEQPLEAPGANWARYYATFFIQRYR